ncbi:DUF6264 family protein [Marisediminicola sp. LYQ85]|uniref:DUF6264 family protein n=1 Tax=Marisediminicola sp. LYQ85 TaxID=3391062 RepID=UPI0039833F8E
MTDERPRPQYGEYATPQDQAHAIAGSHPPVSPALAPHGATPAAEHRAPEHPAPEQQAAVAPTAPVEPRARQTPEPRTPGSSPSDRDGAALDGTRPRRRWDLVLSVVLLSLGLWTVVSGMIQNANLPAVFDDVFEMQGMGDFTADAAATTAGRTLSIINIVLFAITATITITLLRARRIAFYVPLTAGVIAGVIAFIVLASVLLGDPAFAEYAGTQGT